MSNDIYQQRQFFEESGPFPDLTEFQKERIEKMYKEGRITTNDMIIQKTSIITIPVGFGKTKNHGENI